MTYKKGLEESLNITGGEFLTALFCHIILNQSNQKVLLDINNLFKVKVGFRFFV